jgi:hypothetical protein
MGGLRCSGQRRQTVDNLPLFPRRGSRRPAVDKRPYGGPGSAAVGAAATACGRTLVAGHPRPLGRAGREKGLGGRRDWAGEGTGREKGLGGRRDWAGGLTAAVEDEEDPLHCIRASTEDGPLAAGIKQ